MGLLYGRMFKSRQICMEDCKEEDGLVMSNWQALRFQVRKQAQNKTSRSCRGHCSHARLALPCEWCMMRCHHGDLIAVSRAGALSEPQLPAASVRSAVSFVSRSLSSWGCCRLRRLRHLYRVVCSFALCVASLCQVLRLQSGCQAWP